MNIRVRLTAEETRARIVDVAEEHFRRIGYAKTAVSDIAEALGMSSANIYRFFPSKGAINNAICHKIMAESEALADRIVARKGSAAARLTEFIQEIHAFNKGRLTDEHRIHDMVEIAMEEHWPAIDAHCDHIIQVIARLLASGVETGEFAPTNIGQTASILFSCCCSLFHPRMIAECADRDQPQTASHMAAFILLALTNGASGKPVQNKPIQEGQ